MQCLNLHCSQTLINKAAAIQNRGNSDLWKKVCLPFSWHTHEHNIASAVVHHGPETAVSRNIAVLAAGAIPFSSKLLLTCVKLSK